MRKIRILFVEDDETYVFLFNGFIDIKLPGGCEITRVSSRDEADQVYADGIRFDCIICDGHIAGWPSHKEDVQRMYPSTEFVSHTSSTSVPKDTVDGHLVFSKGADGRELLLQWLGEKVRDIQTEE